MEKICLLLFILLVRTAVSLHTTLNRDHIVRNLKLSMRSKAINEGSDVEVNTSVSMNRRLFVNAFTGSAGVASGLSCSSVANAARVKGAAEYDLEYYIRDLVKGNTKEGNLPASSSPPSPPPRKLSSFMNTILNDQCTQSDTCTSIAINELAKLIPSLSPVDITMAMIDFRSKAMKSFYARSQWSEESILDQYYFDVTSYALYRIAADKIPTDYALRNQWIRNVGRATYDELIRQNNVTPPLESQKTLSKSIPTLLQILDFYNDTNFVQGYRLGEKNDVRTGKNVFDFYDDDDIQSGISVNCLVSLFRPATLGASLQITGEGSRFSPDFLGCTLAAFWEKELSLTVEYETYFVDEEYRPNPKDYFPNEQLLQFTIRSKKT